MEIKPKARFTKIQSAIEQLIQKSEKSIQVAVAWFTNKELLGLLIDKAKAGVKVEIIVSDDIINKRIQPKDFIQFGGIFTIYPSNLGKFLHNKFAIFDDKIVLIGSYNWTYFAEYKNEESVVEIAEEIVIKQFRIRFKKLQEDVLAYDTEILCNRQNEGADKEESRLTNLEKELEEEFINTLAEARKLNIKIDFDFVLTFIKTFGGIGAAKKLMQTGTEKVQSGFIKLWAVKRLDLTFEGIITKEKYQFLFDDKTIKNAKERLKQFDEQNNPK